MKSLLLVLTVFTASVSAQDPPPCSTSGEFLTHPDCTKYYICASGTAIEQECPAGLYFSPIIDACDFPANVPECIGGTRPPIIGPTTTTGRSNTTTDETTTDTTPTTIRMSTTKEPTSTEGTTRLPPGVCPPTGIVKIRHEERCDLYYLCVDGLRLDEACASGLYFDETIQECNMADLVNCDSDVTFSPTSTRLPTSTRVPTTTAPSASTTSPELPSCPATGIVHLPYPGNCRNYILCVEEIPIIYKCPDGMLFDAPSAECKPEDVAVCSDTTLMGNHGKNRSLLAYLKNLH